eukprot:14831906-Alexandrium_andersonii.AAC.1
MSRPRVASIPAFLGRSHPSGASGTDSETALGTAQFQVRTLAAILQIRQGGLRAEADYSTDEH